MLAYLSGEALNLGQRSSTRGAFEARHFPSVADNHKLGSVVSFWRITALVFFASPPACLAPEPLSLVGFPAQHVVDYVVYCTLLGLFRFKLELEPALSRVKFVKRCVIVSEGLDSSTQLRP